MPGEKDLEILLANMAPTMEEADYVFCSLPAHTNISHLNPKAFIAEKEGMSLIISKETAVAHDISFDGIYKAITLSVHSSLDAVGLTAAVSTHLAEKGLSANIVAGMYHDHLFIQTSQAELAMQALQALQEFTQ